MPKDDWVFLGRGSYNIAYQSQDGSEVLKIQQHATTPTDTPERSVRLWNAINAHISPPARLANTTYGSGWICPYIEGVQAPDKDMADALVDIFNRTGRIIVDATAKKNFIKTPTGQVVCIDVGMALQFERSEDNGLAAVRRKSEISLNTWRGSGSKYTKFFIDSIPFAPHTVDMVKALLFIKYNRPDIYDASFLKTNPDLVKKLAASYDGRKVENASAHLNIAANPESIPFLAAQGPLEIQSFVQYLRSIGSTYAIITDDQVKDISLSAAYENIDNGKRYVNLEIHNPEILSLFKHYKAKQEQLSQKQMAPEAEAESAEIIVDYRSKFKKIDADFKAQQLPQPQPNQQQQKAPKKGGLLKNILTTLGLKSTSKSKNTAATTDMRAKLINIKEDDIKPPESPDLKK